MSSARLLAPELQCGRARGARTRREEHRTARVRRSGGRRRDGRGANRLERGATVAVGGRGGGGSAGTRQSARQAIPATRRMIMVSTSPLTIRLRTRAPIAIDDRGRARSATCPAARRGRTASCTSGLISVISAAEADRETERESMADIRPSEVSARTFRACRCRSRTVSRQRVEERGERAAGLCLDVDGGRDVLEVGRADPLAHGVDRLVERAPEPLLAEHARELLGGRRRAVVGDRPAAPAGGRGRRAASRRSWPARPAAAGRTRSFAGARRSAARRTALRGRRASAGARAGAVRRAIEPTTPKTNGGDEREIRRGGRGAASGPSARATGRGASAPGRSSSERSVQSSSGPKRADRPGFSARRGRGV